MKSTPASALAKERRAELRSLIRERKRSADAALKQITSLKKQADKLVAAHRESDAKITRRISILESRLSS
jgi:hypothetical protein